MPENDMMDYAHLFTVGQIISAKKRWKVSAMALAYRLNSLGYISEWNYRSLLIELGKRGYRSGEPDGIEREVSTVLRKGLGRSLVKRA